MVNWNLLIKPSETVEEALTLPQLTAALKSRAVVFNKREHMTVLFEKLLEWNRTEYPCMDASQKLPPRDLKISRWGLDQIRVAQKTRMKMRRAMMIYLRDFTAPRKLLRYLRVSLYRYLMLRFGKRHFRQL